MVCHANMMFRVFRALCLCVASMVFLTATAFGGHIMSDCLTPRDAWICGTCHCKSDGVLSRRLVFSPNDALAFYLGITGELSTAKKMMDDAHVSIPCGKCLACLYRKRKHMATRLAHEASLYDNCCFITLTYDDDNIPVTDWRALEDDSKEFSRGLGTLPERTLCVSDVQKFIKRLRRHLEYLPKFARHRVGRDYVDTPIRYFACGEYGSHTHRPHYHLMIFGWKPSDLELLKVHNGKPVYISAQLQKLWRFGFSSVSDVNSAVAQYAARYVTKKLATITEVSDLGHCYKIPEFTLQSVRHGGIGAPWCDKYGVEACSKRFTEIRKADDTIIRVSVPPYYYNRLRRTKLAAWLRIRDERLKFVVSSPLSSRSYDDIRRHVDCMLEFDRQSASREYF